MTPDKQEGADVSEVDEVPHFSLCVCAHCCADHLRVWLKDAERERDQALSEARRLRDRVEGLAERCERNGSKPWVEFAAALRTALEPVLHPSEESEER